MSVTWLPSGFPEGEVKRVQDSYIPYHISYKQKRTPTIPTTQSINPHRGSFNDLPRFDFPNGEKPK